MAAGAGGGAPALDFHTIASLITVRFPVELYLLSLWLVRLRRIRRSKFWLVRCWEWFHGHFASDRDGSSAAGVAGGRSLEEPLVVTLAVLDSGGRKFGNAEVFLVRVVLAIFDEVLLFAVLLQPAFSDFVWEMPLHDPLHEQLGMLPRHG